MDPFFFFFFIMIFATLGLISLARDYPWILSVKIRRSPTRCLKSTRVLVGLNLKMNEV